MALVWLAYQLSLSLQTAASDRASWDLFSNFSHVWIADMLGPALSPAAEVTSKPQTPRPPLRAHEVLTRLRALQTLREANAEDSGKPVERYSDAQLIAMAFRGPDLVFSVPVAAAPMGSPS
ncbi:hypothetical protein B566_EDAN010624 [Ephemera danica]|nr:hypothetical protein B566_EDAN010624 [Ephemera danica]